MNRRVITLGLCVSLSLLPGCLFGDDDSNGDDNGRIDAAPGFDSGTMIDAGTPDAITTPGGDGDGGPADGGTPDATPLPPDADLTPDAAPVECTDVKECDDGSACTTDSCVDGFCENAAITCDDGVGCTDNTCNPATGCVFVPVDAACSDGSFCNGAEVCDATNDCQPGTPVVVDDGIGCTVDSCDDKLGAVVNTPSNAACDDGAFCNGAEVCSAVFDCQAGTAPVTDDGVGCTVDSCDEASDRVVNAPSNAACDDGAFCNGAETCDAVADCQAGTPPVVDDGVGCTMDSCDETGDTIVNTPMNALCDDGAFCNGAETCDPVADCQAGASPIVDDGVGCTVDACDEATDTLSNTPSDARCDDGAFCNGAETCDAVADCQAGAAPVVDDEVGCTLDSCDEVANVVRNVPTDSLCDNDLFCDGEETCDPVLDCQNGPPPVLDDGVGCTDDTCDEVANVVVNTTNNDNCSNGQFCDGEEVCDAVLDCGPGTPPVADDGVGCTVDSCDETGDVIVNTPLNALCDNGAFCDGAETCDAIADCQAGTPPNLDDGVGCTDDACNETSDTIVNTPNSANCDNGVACDGIEICNFALDCQPGTPPVIDDGVDCTIDTCDETLGVLNTPDDTQCNDENACTADSCDVAAGCVAVDITDTCDDGDTCTSDGCSVETGCVNDPLDTIEQVNRQGFEQGAPGWTTGTISGGPNSWTLTDTVAGDDPIGLPDGTAFGNTSNGDLAPEHSFLQTPPFDARGGALVSFQSLVVNEIAKSLNPDLEFVEVSYDGGVNFEFLLDERGTPLDGDNSVWFNSFEPVTIQTSIPSDRGTANTVIRWRYDAQMGDGDTSSIGWYIDNVDIEAAVCLDVMFSAQRFGGGTFSHINLSTAVPLATPRGNMDIGITAMARRSDFRLFALDNNFCGGGKLAGTSGGAFLWEVNQFTGQLTPIAPLTDGDPAFPLNFCKFPDMTFLEDGRLIAWSRFDNELFEIDASNGVVRPIGGFAPTKGTTGNAIASDAADQVWYSPGRCDEDALQNIDPDTGDMDPVGPSGNECGRAGLQAMTWFNGELFGIHGGNDSSVSDLVLIDPDTGAFTTISTFEVLTGGGDDALAGTSK